MKYTIPQIIRCDPPQWTINAPAQTNHRTELIFYKDTPLGTTAGYSGAIFEIQPLSRATGIFLIWGYRRPTPVARLRGQISKIAPEYPAVVPRGVSMQKMGSVR